MAALLTYRDIESLEHCRRVVELEKEVWGYSDAEDVVPVPILVVSLKRGGILIGAFEPAGRMIGFVYSLPAWKHGRFTQWSHMLGVIEEYRSAGVGRELKLRQRQRALDMGVDLVEWTFDPLQAVNAHLNFEKLGVIVSEYEVDIYGESSSPLHQGAPTDRFVAEWWIRQPRVEQRIGTAPPGAVRHLTNLPVVNRTRTGARWLECEDQRTDLTDPELLVEIPMGFTEMQGAAPALAREWRSVTRELFTTYFGRGYVAEEFALDRIGRRGRYLLRQVRQA